jgi:2-desacetyl-2-hydroxyethyl bacteriochlorophyllide A dehydrogenase
MRAVTFQAPMEVRVDERPDPVLEGRDDAIVAIDASGICGSDLHIYHGRVKIDSVAVLGLGPVGLCAVRVAIAAGASPVVAIDSVAQRLEVARSFGATPVHLTEESPRDVVRSLTGGRGGVDACIDAVGHPDALDLAIRLTRKAGTVVAIGVYAGPCRVHMGLVWIKALTLKSGHANVIGHVDRVLGMLAAGTLDPTPLVTHHLPLDDAAEAYEIYDRREALKIVLAP